MVANMQVPGRKSQKEMAMRRLNGFDLQLCSWSSFEYACTMQVDEKSDIYSFGVVPLELLTRKRPMEAEYRDAVNIVKYVREKVQSGEVDVAKVLGRDGVALGRVHEEMTLVLCVALLCTSKAPIDRFSMHDVVTMLSEAKSRRKHRHPPSSTPTTTRIL